jgi:hypothetical protein
MVMAVVAVEAVVAAEMDQKMELLLVTALIVAVVAEHLDQLKAAVAVDWDLLVDLVVQLECQHFVALLCQQVEAVAVALVDQTLQQLTNKMTILRVNTQQ